MFVQQISSYRRAGQLTNWKKFVFFFIFRFWLRGKYELLCLLICKDEKRFIAHFRLEI